MLPLTLLVLLSSEPGSAIEWFQQGRAELKDGRPAQALRSFEHAQALEPALGTLLNIAECHDRLGREVEAWHLFTEALNWARRTREFERVELAGARLADLERRLTMVEVLTTSPSTVVTLNGRQVGARRTPTAPGVITVDAREEGFAPWSTSLDGQPGQVLVLSVPALTPLVAALGLAPSPEPRAGAGPVVLMIAGAAATLAGALCFSLGVSAQTSWYADIQNKVPIENRRISADTFDLTRWGVPLSATVAAVGLALIAGGVWWLLSSSPSQGARGPNEQ